MGFEDFKLKGAQTVALIRAHFKKKTRKNKRNGLPNKLDLVSHFVGINRGYCMKFN